MNFVENSRYYFQIYFDIKGLTFRKACIQNPLLMSNWMSQPSKFNTKSTSQEDRIFDKSVPFCELSRYANITLHLQNRIRDRLGVTATRPIAWTPKAIMTRREQGHTQNARQYCVTSWGAKNKPTVFHLLLSSGFSYYRPQRGPPPSKLIIIDQYGSTWIYI